MLTFQALVVSTQYPHYLYEVTLDGLKVLEKIIFESFQEFGNFFQLFSVGYELLFDIKGINNF